VHAKSQSVIPALAYVHDDQYDRFQQIPFGVFSTEGLTGAKFEVKIWIRIGGSCLGLLQTKTLCCAGFKSRPFPDAHHVPSFPAFGVMK
jgi:hypothetical protein